MSSHPLDEDTAVDPVCPGSYAANLTDRWGRLGGGPLGGYTLSVALAAIQHESPLPDPLTVTTHFLRPATTGRARVDITTHRVGRRTATLGAVLHQGDQAAIVTTATFGDLSQISGPTAIFNRPPALPPPEHCEDWATGKPDDGVTIRDQIECRFPPGQRTPDPDRDQASQHFWISLRAPRPSDLFALPLLVDAAPPAAMLLGATGDLTLELTVHLRAVPRSSRLACRASVRHLVNGLHEEDFELWNGHGTLVAQSRQLALLPGS
jgi:acyl-coenzyme A thioesterase PaaI-like protein